MSSDQTPQPEQNSKLIYSRLTEQIIAAAIEVHRHLGPGLLESVYERCFCHELSLRNIPFEKQQPLNLSYKGLAIDCAYRPDVLVDAKVIVELKAAEANSPIFEAQLLTYLRLSNKRVGLLINFGLPVLKNGIIRRVN